MPDEIPRYCTRCGYAHTGGCVRADEVRPPGVVVARARTADGKGWMPAVFGCCGG